VAEAEDEAGIVDPTAPAVAAAEAGEEAAPGDGAAHDDDADSEKGK